MRISIQLQKARWREASFWKFCLTLCSFAHIFEYIEGFVLCMRFFSEFFLVLLEMNSWNVIRETAQGGLLYSYFAYVNACWCYVSISRNVEIDASCLLSIRISTVVFFSDFFSIFKYASITIEFHENFRLTYDPIRKSRWIDNNFFQ